MQLNLLSKYRSELFGACILGVLAGHALPNMDECQNTLLYYFIKMFSLIGVRGFCFLSGFGLYFSLKGNNTGRRYLKFYEKRLTRVYIPYLCLGIPYFIWLYVIVNPNIVKFLTFVFPVSFWIYGNDQGMWYIDIILIFYLVFPFLYRCIETKNGKIYVITFIILGVALNISLYFLDRAYYELIGIGISKAPLMIYGIYIGKCAYERKTIKYSSMALISAAWFIAYIFVPKEFMGYTWLCDGRSVLGCLYLVLLLSFIKNKCINKILAFLAV